MYELISEREAFIKFKYDWNSGALYNCIRNTNFEFFIENSQTGNKKVDELIANCTNRKPELRPKAAEALK